jgi:hypothetical protein
MRFVVGQNDVRFIKAAVPWGELVQAPSLLACYEILDSKDEAGHQKDAR